MTNVGGPKHRRRSLLSSCLCLRKASPFGQTCSRHVGNRISLPIDCPESCQHIPHRVQECGIWHRRNAAHSSLILRAEVSLPEKRDNTLIPEDLRNEERRSSIDRWPDLRDDSTKGKQNHHLTLLMKVWLNYPHGEINNYLIQIFSRHGWFPKNKTELGGRVSTEILADTMLSSDAGNKSCNEHYCDILKLIVPNKSVLKC